MTRRMLIRSFWQRLRHPESAREAGFVFAFCAMFMTTLITIAGFTIDVGNWYVHANRMQRAADSAALAGSVYLPNDFTKAKGVAEANLANNKFTDLHTVQQSALHPTVLDVSVTKTVPNYFISIIGIKTETMTRRASAEYRPYVPMGSPSNTMGIEYDPSDRWEKASTLGKQGQYWLNFSGGSSQKSSGDRYGASWCDVKGIDNCSTSKPIPTSNSDYSSDGQIFVVKVDPGTTGDLAIQAFDPGMVSVGNQCESNLTNASKINPLYKTGADNPACTGDTMQGKTSQLMSTTFQLWTPEDSPGGSVPLGTAGCNAITFPGYNKELAPLLDPTKSTFDPVLTAEFRKWVTVCHLYIGASYPPGEYLLHVTAPVSSSGANRFGLRAGIVDSTNNVVPSMTNGVSLFSKGRLAMYANAPSAEVQFYLARIGSSAAAHTMTLTFFDIGDTDNGSLTILPPPDATDNGVPMTSFQNCTYKPPSKSTFRSTDAGCSINNIKKADYTNKLVTIEVRLPDGYVCSDTSANGCWTRLRLKYPGGKVVDATSWEVGLDGSPVRLVLDGSEQ